MATSTLGGLWLASAAVPPASASGLGGGAGARRVARPRRAGVGLDVAARWVAWPRSTEEVSAVLHAAAELALRVVARGTGTRLTWGLPPTGLDLIVDVSRMDAVLAHTAGDLVVTVQAGVRMVDLQDA